MYEKNFACELVASIGSYDVTARYVMASSFFERRRSLLLFQPNILTTITMKRLATSEQKQQQRQQQPIHVTTLAWFRCDAEKVNTTNHNSGKFKINGGFQSSRHSEVSYFDSRPMILLLLFIWNTCIILSGPLCNEQRQRLWQRKTSTLRLRLPPREVSPITNRLSYDVT